MFDTMLHAENDDVMQPAVETRALRALEDLSLDLAELRSLFLVALARDDQPAVHVEDGIHKRVDKLVKNVLAIAYGANSTLNFAKYIAADADGQLGRVPAVPDCIICSQPALPRPKRGMDEACYKAFRRSGLHDIAQFKPLRLRALKEAAEQEAKRRIAAGDTGTIVSEPSAH